MDLYLQFTTQEMKTVVIHECNLYAFIIYTIVIYQSLMRYTYTGVCTYAYKCQGV